MWSLLPLWSALALAQNTDRYAQGVASMQAGKASAALKLFEACAGDARDPQRAECAWEAGWIYWAREDWAGAVRSWEQVQKLNPQRKLVADFLGQAQDNQALAAVLERGRQASPRPAPQSRATLRLRAVGDLMIGTDFPEGALPPDDGVGAFAGVASWLQDAELTFGNLEGPLCDGGITEKCDPEKPPGSCYAFRSPTRYGRYFKEAGFDLLSTANNHASDFGRECRLQTEATLQKLGITYSGRPGTVSTQTVEGLKVGMVGFHTNRNSHFVNDIEEAKLIVQAAATDHDIVIVSFHGGAEGGKATRVPVGKEVFYGEDRGDLRAFTHAVIDAGADLVIGHGPHVLRGMELYKDRLIAYSLGNFATYGRFNLKGNAGLGAVLEVELAADGRFLGGKALPTMQINGGIPVPDPQGQALEQLRSLSELDFPGTAIQVGADGALARP
jgi:poly-gamma-glutamate capsule biosynthesis protein CapA/YwtB (metallophosphatase superfamily)